MKPPARAGRLAPMQGGPRFDGRSPRRGLEDCGLACAANKKPGDACASRV